jgi:ABC-2 type transport system permease protein
VAAVVARQAAEVKAARFAAEETGSTFDAALARARTLAALPERLAVEATTIGGREDALPTGFNYTAPANLVLTSFGLLRSSVEPTSRGGPIDQGRHRRPH